MADDERRFRAGLALLKDHDFSRLFTARLISSFGTSMVFVALPFAVLELVGAEHPEPVGYVIASATGSQLLFQLFGGALADRGSRQRMMVAADIMAMLAQGAMATLILTGVATIPLLMGLGAVMGISFAFHWPASAGLVPLVVEREQLQAANSLLSVANSMALGLGAAVGGIIAATAGAGWALGLDAMTFGGSAILIASLRPRLQERNAESSNLLREIVAGWHEFTSYRWLWTIVLQFSILVMGFQATYAVIGPIVAERSMGGVRDWGWISGAFGVGLLVGGLLAMRIRVSRPMLVGVFSCFPLALLPYFLIGPSPLVLVALGAFLAGIGIELFSVFWNTAVQTHVSPEALSRVSAYDAVGSMALAPVGEVFGGTLVAAIGAPTTLWVAVGCVIVPTALVLCVSEVRQMRDPSRDPARA